MRASGGSGLAISRALVVAIVMVIALAIGMALAGVSALSALPRVQERGQEEQRDQEKQKQARDDKDQENAAPKKINLNTATVEELKTLPSIGPVTARSIVEHRRVVGRFRSIEELMAVPGIGRITFAGIRDQVTIGKDQSAAGDSPDDPS